MNFKVLRWLMTHRDALMEIVAVVNKYDHGLSLTEKWALVDEIARIVLPIFSDADEVNELLAVDWDEADDNTQMSFAMGADVAALGVDWRIIVEVILPIVISVLEAMNCRGK